MKRKQKFQKFLNSVVKSHGDIEEDWKEIETNVKKILELFENSSGNISDRSDFVSLLNDVKKRYHALYGWHDGLIGKIKNKVHHRKGKSSSESSDSGSESSTDEDGLNEIQEQKLVKQLSLENHHSFKDQIDILSKRNAELEAQNTSIHAEHEENHRLSGELIEKLEDEVQTVRNSLKLLDAENEFLKAERAKSKDEESKLSLLVSGLREENELLLLEKEKVSSKLLKADNSIIELKLEVDKIMEDAGKLREDNSSLKEDLARRARELFHLNQQIMSMNEERETLRVIVTEHELANGSLMSENAEMLIENQNLKAQNEASIQQVSNLDDQLMMMRGENDALKSEVLNLSAHMDKTDKIMNDMSIESGLLKEDISKLHDVITDLNLQLKVKDDENYVKELESSSKMNLLREENNELLNKHENLKLQLEDNNQELSKIKQVLEDTASERNLLADVKSALLSKINEGRTAIDGLKAQIEVVESEKTHFQEQISSLDLECQSANVQFTVVKNALVAAEEERIALVSENSVVKSKLCDAELRREMLQNELEELNEKNSILQSKVEEADKKMIIESGLLKEDISKLNDTISDLNHHLKVKNDENYAMVLESRKAMQQAEERIMILSAETEMMKRENSMLSTGHGNLVQELEANNQELSKHKQALGELETEMNSLKEEKSLLLDSHENLTMASKAREFERDSLIEEKSAFLNKMNEDKLAIDDLKGKIEEIESEKSQLQLNTSNLDLEFQSANLELINVKNALMAIEEERKVLVFESSTVKSKLQEAESMNGRLQTELGNLNQKNSVLLSQIEDVEKDRANESALLKEDISKLHDIITNLNHKLKLKDDEIYAMLLESSSKMNSLREENAELFTKHENLKLELEGYNQELSKVKHALEVAEYERNLLIDEKSVLLSKINDGRTLIDSLKAQVEAVESEKSQLQLKISALDLECQSAILQFADVKNAFVAAEEERSALDSENSVVKSRLQDAELRQEMLQNELGELKHENSILLSKVEEAEENLIVESGLLKEGISNLHNTITDLNCQLKVRNDENYAMVLESSESRKVIQQAEERIMILSAETERMKSENSMLLAVHENLMLELKGNNQELSKHKQALEDLETDMNSLREEKSLLLDSHEKLTMASKATEIERDSLIEEKSALLYKINEDKMAIGVLKAKIEEIESEKSQLHLKISDLDLEFQSANLQFINAKTALVAAEDEKKVLVFESSTVQNKLQEAEFMNGRLQTELEELNLKNSILQSKIEQIEKDMTIESGLLKEDISKLHDVITGLNHQLKVKDDENSAMALESSESLKVIQQAEEKIMILSAEAERIKNENSMLLAGHENLKLELESNNEELSIHKQSLETLKCEMNSEREEKSFLLSRHENLKQELKTNNLELSNLNQALEAAQFMRNSLVEEKSVFLNKINEGGMAIDGLKAHIEEVENEKSHLQMKIRSLELECQSSNLKFIDMENAFVAVEEEKKALLTENSTVKSKLQETEFMKQRLETELVELNKKNSILLSNIEEAGKNISMLNVIITDLKHQLNAKKEENYALTLESSESRKVVQQAEEKIMILSAEAERMKNENSILLAMHENMKLELEDHNQEQLELKQALKAIESEKNSLIEVKSSHLAKLNEAGMAIDGLITQIKETESEKSQLQAKNCNMELEMQSAILQFTEVKNALADAEEKNKALVLENSVVVCRVHDAEFTQEKLQTELEELNQKNSIFLSRIEEFEKSTNDFNFKRDELLADNAQLEIKVKELNMKLEAATIQLSHLEDLLLLAEQEKTKLVSEISELTVKLELTEAGNEKLKSERDLIREENTAFQQNQEELQNKMVDYFKKWELTLSEVEDLDNKLEQIKKEALHEVHTWIETFKRDLLKMISAKDNFDKELKKLADICSENEVSLKKLDDLLRKKVSEQETLLKTYEELNDKHKQLQDSYYESSTKLGAAEKKVEEMELKEEAIERLEQICAEHKNDIGKWSENCRELLEKLSFAEVGKVDTEKELQRLEVQLRLSNQKLKVTETEYKEKEESCSKFVAGLQEERRLLDRHVLIWSRKYSELNDNYKQIKVLLDTGMENLVNELLNVESTSLESMGYIKKQLAECLLELHSLKTALKSEFNEKKKLRNENHELAKRLADNEGIILKLKDEESQKLAHLSEKEEEHRILVRRVAELEKNLKEKEREVLDKDEQKREAIRQLCLVIEHHWENHNYLVRHLSSVLQSRGAS